MGLFDGYDGSSEAGSTAQMAKWLGLPVLLVVDARAMARSAAALVHGFASFDPDLTLAGVVFNRIGGAGHLHYLEQALSSLARREVLRRPAPGPGTGHPRAAPGPDHRRGPPFGRGVSGAPGRFDGSASGPGRPAGGVAGAVAAGGAATEPPRPHGAPGGGPGPGLLLLLSGKFGIVGPVRGRTGAVFTPDRPGIALQTSTASTWAAATPNFLPLIWPPTRV